MDRQLSNAPCHYGACHYGVLIVTILKRLCYKTPQRTVAQPEQLFNAAEPLTDLPVNMYRTEALEAKWKGKVKWVENDEPIQCSQSEYNTGA